MSQGDHRGEKLLEPRVVILEHERGPKVGVVEIPQPAKVGAKFEHGGRWWRIFARRDRSRVLLATETASLDVSAFRA